MVPRDVSTVVDRRHHAGDQSDPVVRQLVASSTAVLALDAQQVRLGAVQ